MAKAIDVYLLKVFNNGKFSVIAWSPMQAKKGYAVLSKSQAKPYLDLAKKGKGHIDNLKSREFVDSIKKVFEVSGKAGRDLADKLEAQKLEDVDDSETQKIVKDVASNNESNQTIDGDEVRELSITQETIQIKEAKYIKGLQHKSTLETHMLEKYQCELPSGRLDIMKTLANSMITDLAKDNRLYLVDGQVTK